MVDSILDKVVYVLLYVRERDTSLATGLGHGGNSIGSPLTSALIPSGYPIDGPFANACLRQGWGRHSLEKERVLSPSVGGVTTEGVTCRARAVKTVEIGAKYKTLVLGEGGD
jgi:hypothetical protein